MNELKLFENKEFGKVRVNLINNEPYFNLNDVCKILGLTNVSKVKSRLEPKGVTTSYTLTSKCEKPTPLGVGWIAHRT